MVKSTKFAKSHQLYAKNFIMITIDYSQLYCVEDITFINLFNEI